MEKSRIERILGKIFLSVGCGGFLAYYLIEMCRAKLLPVSEEIRELVETGRIQDIKIDAVEPIIMLISIFSLLIAPLFIQWNKKSGIKILTLLCAFFIDTSGAIIVIATGEISKLYMICLWISSIYVVWICMEIIHVIYAWVRVQTPGDHYDIAKLTFLWAIIAFILGKVW